MKASLIALLGASISVMAFPPFGPGLIIVVGIALFLASLRLARTRKHGLGIGALYGVAFFGGLMWWLVELELIALILVPVQAAFLAAYGWWLAGHRDRPPGSWLGLAVGGWAVMELVRYHLPVGGLEWGAAGYALSDGLLTRFPAATVGTSGLTLMVVLSAGTIALAARREWASVLWWAPAAVAALLAISVVVAFGSGIGATSVAEVAIVQGSTPCPFEHCSPNERLRTFQQHLQLTKTIEPGSVDIVIWSEGSTGATNADPVLNPEIREAIAEQARRLGAWFLIGGDRTLDDRQWINANVVFDPQGVIIGEYRKQHPVPFGEYVPLRRLFGLIPATRRVPRDMIRGSGPVIFDMAGQKVGSVISFEGGFSIYALEHRREGAEIIVVATNEGSYGLAPTSDQFIGMTRMRAVELGVPVVHAAVTGRSTFIDPTGEIGEITGLGTKEIIVATIGEDVRTPFSLIGNSLLWLTAFGAVLLRWRLRALVGSGADSHEGGTIDDAGA